MADSRVTVVPMLNEALQAVRTPYVAFEHPFKDRPGRFERQADCLDEYGGQYFWTIGDVWPAAVEKPMMIRTLRRALRGIPRANYLKNFMWPEGVLYHTCAAQLISIDERVVYRPQLAYWLRLYEEMGGAFADGALLSTEAHIEVPDRVGYPHKPAVPKIAFAPATLPLTLIAATDDHAATLKQSLKSLSAQTFTNWELRIVDCGSTDGTREILDGICDPRIVFLPHTGRRTRGNALNLAMESACGERIAIWEPTCTALPQRLERQLMFQGDMVGCQLAEISEKDGYVNYQPRPSDLLYYAFTRYSVIEPIPFPSLMFHRKLVQQHGGFDTKLSVRYGYEFELRVLDDQQNSYGRLETELVLRLAAAPNDETTVYGRYYYTLVGRDIAAGYNMKRGCHEWAVNK